MKLHKDGRPSKTIYVGFANAKLPDTDYRISFARDSRSSEVYLVLPQKPRALPEAKYIRLSVGEGLHFRTIIDMLRIPSILRSVDADIAHFFATQFALAGPPLARLSGVRSIVTITGLGRAFNRGGISVKLMKAAYLAMFRVSAACSEAVLFQNEDNMRKLAQHASLRAQEKFHLIGSSIDSSMFENQPAKPAGLPLCVMVARVHPTKGVSDFLAIARSLQSKAEFVLVGPSSAGAEDLLESVRQAENEGVVRYEGQREDWEVRDLLKRASVLVIPSRGEGIPRVVLEASLSGVAVVGYDIAGCRATLPTAALAPSFNLLSLEALTLQALSNMEFRSQLAQDGRSIANKKFSSDEYTKNLDGIITYERTPRRTPSERT